MKRLLFALVCLCSAQQLAAAGTGAAGAANYFAGLALVDQDGRKLDLYRDLMQEHTVVLNAFFAHCTASCPVTMNTLKSLQKTFGQRMDKEVRLLSITVDPQNDTPTSLHAYAERLGAHAGWYFLTGTPDQVAAALKRIGQYSDKPDDHMSLMIAGNLRTGLWKKIFAEAPSGDIARLVLGVADDNGG